MTAGGNAGGGGRGVLVQGGGAQDESSPSESNGGGFGFGGGYRRGGQGVVLMEINMILELKASKETQCQLIYQNLYSKYIFVTLFDFQSPSLTQATHDLAAHECTKH